VSGKRNNEYWLGVLKRRFPGTYAAFREGKYKSVREARRAVGLIDPPSRLKELQRHWRGADAAQRSAFQKWVEAETTKGEKRARKAAAEEWLSPADLLDRSGYLSTPAALQIDKIKKERGIKGGDARVNEAMGYSRYDPKLGFARARRSKPTTEFLSRLHQWMKGR